MDQNQELYESMLQTVQRYSPAADMNVVKKA